MKCLIVDDEEPARAACAVWLAAYPDLEWAKLATAGGVAQDRELRPDLLFLDIELPGSEGSRCCMRCRAR